MKPIFGWLEVSGKPQQIQYPPPAGYLWPYYKLRAGIPHHFS